MDDDELLERFAANTLPAFPHEEHLRVVFAKSAHAGVEQTITFLRDGIQSWAIAADMVGAYHETRTVAWVRRVVAARADFTGTFDEFLDLHPELRRRDLLDEHYSPELLNSPAAREGFVEPDRDPLP
ncbi:MAG: hypothetical protein ABI435_04645 [Pseudolysinimonas sp.]